MFGKGSRLYGILRMKCPRCHEGNIFLYRNPYNLSKLGKMHNSCPECGQSYNLEPGFYYGAAILSYVINIFILIASFFILWAFMDFKEEIFIPAMIMIGLAFVPLTFTFSRTIWLSMFVKYKGNPKKNGQSH